MGPSDAAFVACLALGIALLALIIGETLAWRKDRKKERER